MKTTERRGLTPADSERRRPDAGQSDAHQRLTHDERRQARRLLRARGGARREGCEARRLGGRERKARRARRGGGRSGGRGWRRRAHAALVARAQGPGQGPGCPGQGRQGRRAQDGHGDVQGGRRARRAPARGWNAGGGQNSSGEHREREPAGACAIETRPIEREARAWTRAATRAYPPGLPPAGHAGRTTRNRGDARASRPIPKSTRSFSRISRFRETAPRSGDSARRVFARKAARARSNQNSSG